MRPLLVVLNGEKSQCTTRSTKCDVVYDLRVLVGSVSRKAEPLGVFFSHGQEGDQFLKADRAFCHLDVRRMLAAIGFSTSLPLEDLLKL
jgi:hypothetical protein